MDELLASGVDVNARLRVFGSDNLTHWTPVMRASYYGQPDVVDLLVRQGADLDAESLHGSTALHLAAQGHRSTDAWTPERLAVVYALLTNGSNVNAADHKGYVALHYAVQSNDVSAVQLLLEHGAVTDFGSEHGQTPLVFAVLDDRASAIVKVLLASGADADVTLPNGVSLREYLRSNPAVGSCESRRLILCNSSDTCNDRREQSEQGGR